MVGAVNDCGLTIRVLIRNVAAAGVVGEAGLKAVSSEISMGEVRLTGV